MQCKGQYCSKIPDENEKLCNECDRNMCEICRVIYKQYPTSYCKDCIKKKGIPCIVCSRLYITTDWLDKNRKPKLCEDCTYFEYLKCGACNCNKWVYNSHKYAYSKFHSSKGDFDIYLCVNCTDISERIRNGEVKEEEILRNKVMKIGYIKETPSHGGYESEPCDIETEKEYFKVMYPILKNYPVSFESHKEGNILLYYIPDEIPPTCDDGFCGMRVTCTVTRAKIVDKY